MRWLNEGSPARQLREHLLRPSLLSKCFWDPQKWTDGRRPIVLGRTKYLQALLTGALISVCLASQGNAKGSGQRVDADSVGSIRGSDAIRTRPPIPRVRTTEAIGVHGYEAVVTGVINPRGQVTHYKFQYGRTRSYGKITDVSEEVVTGHEDRKVAAALFRLTPKTTYHFRIIAFNRRGSVHGQDRTFTTTRN